MQLSMDLGQIALIVVQIIMLVITFYSQARQASAIDIEKRDRGIFGANVTEALRVAQAALRGVELIEVDHYRTLASKHAKSLEEIEDLKIKILALEESVKSLSNKLASRQRADFAEMKRAQVLESEEINPPVGKITTHKGEYDLEQLKALGLAVPLATQPQAQPINNSVPFGKSVRG